MFGTCFGCQLLAQAFGGRAGSNPKGKFVLQREELKCADAMLRRADYKSAAAVVSPASGAASGRLSVFESHADQVLALPPGAEALAGAHV